MINSPGECITQRVMELFVKLRIKNNIIQPEVTK